MKYYGIKVNDKLEVAIALRENFDMMTIQKGLRIKFEPEQYLYGRKQILEAGYSEIERKEFNDFFIAEKSKLDNFIKEL
jgi:hypothetical protein